MPHAYTEDQLVEQPAIELFGSRDLLLPKLISGKVEVDRIRMKDEG